MGEDCTTAATGKNGEERTPEKRQPEDVEWYALDQSQWSAMETNARALRALAECLFPIRQVAGGWPLGDHFFGAEQGSRYRKSQYRFNLCESPRKRKWRGKKRKIRQSDAQKVG